MEHRPAERTGEGRVDIANNQNEIGFLIVQDFFEGHHRLCGLNRLCSGSDPQMVVRFGKFQVAEKDSGHLPVVVLIRVNKGRQKRLRVLSKGPEDRGNFHKVWPRTRDKGDTQHEVRSFGVE